MLGASFSLELSKWYELSTATLMRLRNTLGSSNDASSSSVSMESVRMESRPVQSLSLPGPERFNPHSLLQVGSGLMITPCS